MMKIKQKMNNATNKLQLLPALEQLKNDLKKLGPVPNNVQYKLVNDNWLAKPTQLPIPQDNSLLDYAVKFFNITTRFQDKYLETLKSTTLANKSASDILIRHIENSGHGDICRTERNQPVTDENVFLGNIFGIWTFSIKDWKESFAKHADAPNHDFVKWAVCIYQLQNFLKSHVTPMQNLINSILNEQQNTKTGIVDAVFDKIALFKQNSGR